MADERRLAIDWRDAPVYAPLLGADRTIFAWEWLRRDADYRAAALGALERCAPSVSPLCWGLHRFEDPDLTAPEARPVWTRGICAEVLQAEVLEGGQPAEWIGLDSVADFVTVARQDGCERLLLSDGLRTIRLDLLTGSMLQGPALLRFLLEGLASVDGPLLALRRLLVLVRNGRFSASLHLHETKASRWIRLLRTHDALAEGIEQREIAAVLLSASAEEPRWRTEVPSLRSRAQRLVRAARQMRAGGYRALLGPACRRHPNG